MTFGPQQSIVMGKREHPDSVRQVSEGPPEGTAEGALEGSTLGALEGRSDGSLLGD